MTRYWVGGYTGATEGGIGVLDAGAALASRGLAGPTSDPSALLASPDRPELLYAVDEGGDGVVALRRSDDGLEVVSRVGTAGAAPCHLSIAADGSLLLAACYGDGVVSVHRLDDDGLPGPGAPLAPPSEAPTGPHPAQDGPHAHATLEVGDLLLVADLGTDRVHRFRRARDGFAPAGSIVLPPGCGPRDLLPLPSGRVLLLGEHDRRVHVLDPDLDAPLGSAATTVDPVPGDQAAGMTLAGDRLTAGLRGSDRIAVLRLDADDVPQPVGSIASGGVWPRHHVLDTTGVLVANERSGTVTRLPWRPDGLLGAADASVAVPRPTFLLPVAS